LSGNSSFKRWDWVNFRYTKPTRDTRPESCRVHEESIVVDGKLPRSDQADFLNPLVLPSINVAIEKKQSLALIRPKNTRFTFKKKTPNAITAEREAFERAARQTSLFDRELATLTPTPYEFRFKFEDDSRHDFQNGDWEAHAMFYNGIKRGDSEQKVLDWMGHIFNEVYPQQGMLFALGNQAKRPQVWQLLGVLRVDDSAQGSLPL
tara:strand:- start:111 stop:728 length:618 start_codon:yes stop_codon:yes gene_type:complete